MGWIKRPDAGGSCCDCNPNPCDPCCVTECILGGWANISTFPYTFKASPFDFSATSKVQGQTCSDYLATFTFSNGIFRAKQGAGGIATFKVDGAVVRTASASSASSTCVDIPFSFDPYSILLTPSHAYSFDFSIVGSACLSDHLYSELTISLAATCPP